MTHFLARLVERARGTAPRVEPTLAPRFAAAPVAEMASEHEAPPPARGATQEKNTANGSQDVFVRQEKPATDESRLRKEPTATREPEKREATSEATSEILLVPLERPKLDEVIQRPDETRASDSPQREVLPHLQSATPVRGTNSKHLRPAVSKSSMRPPFSNDSLAQPNESLSDERPIVRVTIGRIEVRAAPAPAASPYKAAPRSEPKLTLDAYLKARKEGAR